MFTKVSEQRSAARRYALSKVAAGPRYNTDGWAPPVVANIPKNETPSYAPEEYRRESSAESAQPAYTSKSYKPFYLGTDGAIRAALDPRYRNWAAAHNSALRSLPVNAADAPYTSMRELPETRKALADAYHRRMYALTNDVPTSASVIYTR